MYRNSLLAGGDFVEILDKTLNSSDKKILKVNRKPEKYTHPVVSYESKGKATFKFGAKQRVDLDEEPLNVDLNNE